MHWAHHSTVHCSHKAGCSAVHTGPEEIPSKKAFNDKTSFQNFYHLFMDDPPTRAAVLSSSLKKINLVLRTFFRLTMLQDQCEWHRAVLQSGPVSRCRCLAPAVRQQQSTAANSTPAASAETVSRGTTTREHVADCSSGKIGIRI